MSVKLDSNKNTIYPPLLSIRRICNDEDQILLSNPLNKKRVLVDRESFLSTLLRNEEAEQNESPVVLKLQELGMLETNHRSEMLDEKLLQHWFFRKWIPSLDYYLWSRDCKYYDSKSVHDSDVKRKEVLEAYTQKDFPKPRSNPQGLIINLPEAKLMNISKSVSELLFERRTTRIYRNEECSIQSLSNILWYGLDSIRNTRINQNEELLEYLKSYGVAFDFYFFIYSVESIEPGIYFYDVIKHQLVQIEKGNLREQMSHNIIEQSSPKTANWTLCIVADFEQYQWRYRHERALRHLFLETGRISQHLLIAGLFHKIGTLTTPAIRDKEVSKLLKLDPKRYFPMYTLTMGLCLEERK